ncbi:MAG: hypothetical protein WC867_03835 [Candidatus Pacearchaeota archaeon]|jgi:hypothetical protein
MKKESLKLLVLIIFLLSYLIFSILVGLIFGISYFFMLFYIIFLFGFIFMIILYLKLQHNIDRKNLELKNQMDNKINSLIENNKRFDDIKEILERNERTYDFIIERFLDDKDNSSIKKNLEDLRKENLEKFEELNNSLKNLSTNKRKSSNN